MAITGERCRKLSPVSTDKTRQYGPLKDIRRDHVQRYLLASQQIQKGSKVLDLACGCGYGSWMLQQVGLEVTGVDIEPEAISYAEENYPGPKYLCMPAEEVKGKYDAIVSFETLEHLENPGAVLKAIEAPLVIASVPNEQHLPFSKKRFSGDKYPHRRHYTPPEFAELLGHRKIEWFCQKDKGGDIHPGTEGIFVIAVCR